MARKLGSIDDLHLNSLIDKDLECELDGSGNYLYVGFATPGSATSDPAWQIAQISYDLTFTSTPIRMRYANGTDGYVNVWDKRSTYTYLP